MYSFSIAIIFYIPQYIYIVRVMYSFSIAIIFHIPQYIYIVRVIFYLDHIPSLSRGEFRVATFFFKYFPILYFLVG